MLLPQPGSVWGASTWVGARPVCACASPRSAATGVSAALPCRGSQGETLGQLYEAIQTQEVRYPAGVPIRCVHVHSLCHVPKAPHQLRAACRTPALAPLGRAVRVLAFRCVLHARCPLASQLCPCPDCLCPVQRRPAERAGWPAEQGPRQATHQRAGGASWRCGALPPCWAGCRWLPPPAWPPLGPSQPTSIPSGIRARCPLLPFSNSQSIPTPHPPTPRQLLHHPWVAEDPERMQQDADLDAGIERMDDILSMESFIRELASRHAGPARPARPSCAARCNGCFPLTGTPAPGRFQMLRPACWRDL